MKTNEVYFLRLESALKIEGYHGEDGLEKKLDVGEITLDRIALRSEEAEVQHHVAQLHLPSE